MCVGGGLLGQERRFFGWGRSKVRPAAHVNLWKISGLSSCWVLFSPAYKAAAGSLWKADSRKCRLTWEGKASVGKEKKSCFVRQQKLIGEEMLMSSSFVGLHPCYLSVFKNNLLFWLFYLLTLAPGFLCFFLFPCCLVTSCHAHEVVLISSLRCFQSCLLITNTFFVFQFYSQLELGSPLHCPRSHFRLCFNSLLMPSSANTFVNATCFSGWTEAAWHLLQFITSALLRWTKPDVNLPWNCSLSPSKASCCLCSREDFAAKGGDFTGSLMWVDLVPEPVL